MIIKPQVQKFLDELSEDMYLIKDPHVFDALARIRIILESIIEDMKDTTDP